jgi:glycosyltransferase involved in cell wall biosynthesis
MCSELKKRGAVLDLYTTTIVACEAFPFEAPPDNIFRIPVKGWSLFRTGDDSPGFLPNPGGIFSFFCLDRSDRKIADKINKGHYDLAFVNNGLHVNVPSLLKYLDIPSCFYCAEPDRGFVEASLPPFNREGNHLCSRVSLKVRSLRFRWEREAIKKARKILTNSRYSQGVLARTYSVKAEALYLATRGQKKILSQIKKTKPSLLCVGQLTAVKAYAFLLEALGEIPEPQRPKLEWVSHRASGDDERLFRELAHRHRVEAVLSLNLSEMELEQRYRQADFFVFAAYREPFGLVLLEALAQGLPIVAVQEGAVAEIIEDGINGCLSPRDPKAFALACKKLLEDQKLKEEMSRNALESSLKWTWEKTGDRLWAFCQDLVP